MDGVIKKTDFEDVDGINMTMVTEMWRIHEKPCINSWQVRLNNGWIHS